jgi:hypothetical protein
MHTFAALRQMGFVAALTCTVVQRKCRVKHFSSFEFFLLPSIVHTRPPATNANLYPFTQTNPFK